ncbi:hypothetical protein VTN77DRAFT_5322 [Rasamsonia byssochlamydoides]|uniref:uncharacterized protein n=1 Tax=Rasamsonia byssochlamydoides TaxID=89139 RepID=UPI0037440F2F
MSSHVVVIDSTARRAVVKTTPSKPLADVLHEACAKLGFDASQYGLKYQSKQLDLSLSVRLAGLSSGAKLELVQLSRSPSVVNVALQLPEAEAQGAPNGRLMDKFPSTTTLWQVLRKFEAGVAGNGTTRNLTGRGGPATDSGDAGAGRLYYQTPVIRAMGRELSSFEDLQKSLAQLGFNSGNVLLRLSFRTTREPLEEAKAKITEYFKAFEDQTSPAAAENVAPEQTALAQPTEQISQIVSSTQPAPVSIESSEPSQLAPSETSASPSVSSRPVTVYRPPTSTTPLSALADHNEEDYVPTIEHAKSHQERLSRLSRNTRLMSDAEIAEKAAAEQEKLAGIKEVEVKIRFPEQSQVVAKFGQLDTGATLYNFVRSCLTDTIAGEKFSLTLFGGGGGGQARLGGSRSQTISDSDQTYLIKDFGMRGRVLINFTWDDQASPAARGSGANLLKPELRSQAQDIHIPTVPTIADEEEPVDKSSLGRLVRSEDGESSKSKSSERRGGGGGMPKWFKMPGKK